MVLADEILRGEPRVRRGVDELLKRLKAAAADPLSDEGDLMALARAGALLILSRAEIDEAGKVYRELPARPRLRNRKPPD